MRVELRPSLLGPLLTLEQAAGTRAGGRWASRFTDRKLAYTLDVLPASSDFVTKDYITLGVAIWGAVLSTTVVSRQLLQARRRIQVQIAQRLAIEEQPDRLREHWRVRIVNVGSRPLEITHVGLIVKTTDSVTGRYGPEPLGFDGAAPDHLPPFFLNDGQTEALFFRVESEGRYCDVRGAVALDASEREYLGFLATTGRLQRLRVRFALRRTRGQNRG